MAQADIDTTIWVKRDQPSPARRPPVGETGIAGWLRANLFSSVGNTLLTVVTVLALAAVIPGLVRWIFGAAYWEPVWINRKLFAVGTYPQAQLLQPCLVLALVSFVLGLSAGRWGSLLRHVAAGLAAILLCMTLLPVGPAAQIWMGISLGLLIAGFFMGLRLPVPGRALAGAWALSIPISLIILHGSLDVQPLNLSVSFFGSTVSTNFYGGLMLTVLLTVVGIAFSFPLGVALAVGRRSKLPVIRYFCIGYIELIRGVPLISILFMGMLVLPLFLPRGWPNPAGITRVMVAITLFSAAYLAENVRGGLQSIPRGQDEAADALGLRPWQKMRLIILPQALRAVIPAIVGQFIALFKDTSLVTLIGMSDLLGIGRVIIQQPAWLNIAGGISREVYVFVAFVYFIFSFGMSWASRRIEERLSVGQK
jgi:general L-amino acid transport system permease protein